MRWGMALLTGMAVGVLALGGWLARAGGEREEVQVSGQVALEGQGLHLARILALDAQGGEVARARTDEAGRFTLRLPPGTYRFRAEAPGFLPAESPPVDLRPGLTRHALGTLTLRPGDTGATGRVDLPDLVQNPRPFGGTASPWEEGPPPLPALQAVPAYPNLPPLDRPVHLAFAPNGWALAVEQRGRVLAFPHAPDASALIVALDLRDRVLAQGNEQGLLGLALDPAFPERPYLYVTYTAPYPQRTVVSRFRLTSLDPPQADPASELVLLEVEQPFANHNGGTLAFGPDGYLYIGLGDGGAGGDPLGHGQNPRTLLGAFLRLDVRNATPQQPYAVPLDNPFVGREAEGRPEVWAYGFRNPWKFSFDRATGDLWAGDVGQNEWEEVDRVVKGGNYGWNRLEGSHCYPPRSACDPSGTVLPVWEYPTRAPECAVVGGYVYRGTRIPDLVGAYLFGDYCSGKVWGLQVQGEEAVAHALLVDTPFLISSFAEDPEGELYLLDHAGGRIYRLERAL